MKKEITLQTAVGWVENDVTLALGGQTLYRRPVAFVRALIGRYLQTKSPHDLTLLAFTAGYESDLLVGAGMVRSVRSCYFGLESFGFAPMFSYLANRGEIEIIEETEASLAQGLRAAMANVGFMPGKAWLGTDLPSLRPDLKTVVDPYNGETLMAFPAIHADIAVIHALQADTDGNILIGNNKGVDEELALTAKTVIVTAEQIVPELERADIVAPLVDFIVLAPRGALPTSCHPYYPLDGERILQYTEQVSDPVSYKNYLERWLED